MDTRGGIRGVGGNDGHHTRVTCLLPIGSIVGSPQPASPRSIDGATQDDPSQALVGAAPHMFSRTGA